MAWLSAVLSNVVLASLISLAAWFVQCRLRRPDVARWLWLLVFFKLATPPVVDVPIGGLTPALACTLGVCGCPPHEIVPSSLWTMLPWILAAVWSIGACVTFVNVWRCWARLRRLLAHSHAAPEEWQTLAARLSSALALRQAPEVRTVPGTLPPLAVPGRRRPIVLLPVGLLGQLNATQREALLLHELIHINRRDHLVRFVESAIGVVYWWLPIVRSVGRRLRECEEFCCDAAVVARLPKAKGEYARLLLDVLDFAASGSPRAVPHGTAMNVSQDLEQRLTRILNGGPARRGTLPAVVCAAVVACAILPCELCIVSPRAANSAAAPADHVPSARAWFASDAGCDAVFISDLGCPS